MNNKINIFLLIIVIFGVFFSLGIDTINEPNVKIETEMTHEKDIKNSNESTHSFFGTKEMKFSIIWFLPSFIINIIAIIIYINCGYGIGKGEILFRCAMILLGGFGTIIGLVEILLCLKNR